MLTKAGAHVNKANNLGQTPIGLATRNGHLETVKFLEKAGADVNKAIEKGRSPLLLASSEGHFEIVKFLYEAGAYINIADDDGKTAILEASCKGHFEIVKFLETVGADVNKADEDGRPPVWWASEKGHSKIVDFLGNINLRLCTACERGDVEVVKSLLSKGADKNSVNDDKKTPLVAAAENGHLETVQVLVGAGADVKIADEKGQTPLMHAMRSKRNDIALAILDSQIISSDEEEKSEDFELKLKFGCLLNPTADESQIEILHDMTKEESLKDILVHPLITTFLDCKWERLERFYNLDIKFHVLFVFFLTWFIMKINDPLKECNFLLVNYCNNTRENNTVSLGNWTKNAHDDPWFIAFFVLTILGVGMSFVNATSHLIFGVSLTRYIQLFWYGISKKDFKKKNRFKFELLVMLLTICICLPVLIFQSDLIWLYLLGLTTLLLLKECYPMYSSGIIFYLKSKQNCFEVILIFLMVAILIPDNVCHPGIKKYFEAISILIAWTELILLMAKHPKINQSLYLLMFWSVMVMFLKVFALFSLIIFAFGFGFYIMLHEEMENKDEKFFTGPWTSQVKTIVMFIGEINLTEFSSTPGYIYLMCFIFEVSIVLMNLLNALAIDVTRDLVKQAEILSIASNISTLFQLDKSLLKFNFNGVKADPDLELRLNSPYSEKYWLSEDKISKAAKIAKSNKPQKEKNKITFSSLDKTINDIHADIKAEIDKKTTASSDKIISDIHADIKAEIDKKTSALQENFDKKIDNNDTKISALQENFDQKISVLLEKMEKK